MQSKVDQKFLKIKLGVLQGIYFIDIKLKAFIGEQGEHKPGYTDLTNRPHENSKLNFPDLSLRTDLDWLVDLDVWHFFLADTSSPCQ